MQGVQWPFQTLFSPVRRGSSLTLESMSSTMPFGGRRPWTISIHWPERSASANRFFSAVSKQAIGKYLARVLATLPYGKGSKLMHVVGSDQGGGFEWTNDANAVKRGIVAIDLNGAGQIERLDTTWDNAVMSDADLQAPVVLSIEK